MKKISICLCKSKKFRACKYHKKYPYLLKNKVIRYPNQVWSTDITYIKLPTGMFT